MSNTNIKYFEDGLAAVAREYLDGEALSDINLPAVFALLVRTAEELADLYENPQGMIDAIRNQIVDVALLLLREAGEGLHMTAERMAVAALNYVNFTWRNGIPGYKKRSRFWCMLCCGRGGKKSSKRREGAVDAPPEKDDGLIEVVL